MAIISMEGFETSKTGGDLAARGVRRLSTFAVDINGFGRDGGQAFARIGNSTTNSMPGITAAAADPCIFTINKTPTELWNAGGFAVGMDVRFQTGGLGRGIGMTSSTTARFGQPAKAFDINFVTGQISDAVVNAQFSILANQEGPARFTPFGDIAIQQTARWAEWRATGASSVVRVDDLFAANLSFVDTSGTAFVACGSDGGSSSYKLKRSTDFVTWTDVGPTDQGTRILNNVRYLPDMDLWVAVSTGMAYVSEDDGLTWTSVALPSSAAWYEIASDGVSICLSGANGITAISADRGMSWVGNQISGQGDFVALASFGVGKFIAAATTSTNTIRTVDNGLTWTASGPTERSTSAGCLIGYADRVYRLNYDRMLFSTDGSEDVSTIVWENVFVYSALNSGQPGSWANGVVVGMGSINPSSGVIVWSNSDATIANWPHPGTTVWYYYPPGGGGTVPTTVEAPNDTWIHLELNALPTTTPNQFSLTWYANGEAFTQDQMLLLAPGGATNLFVSLPRTGINFADNVVVTDYTAPNPGLLGDTLIRRRQPSADVQAEFRRVPAELPSNAVAAGTRSYELSNSRVEAVGSAAQTDKYAGTVDLSGIDTSSPIGAVQTEGMFKRSFAGVLQVQLGEENAGTESLTEVVQLDNQVTAPTYVQHLTSLSPSDTTWTREQLNASSVVIKKLQG